MPAFISYAQTKANTVDKIIAVVGDQIILSSEIKTSVSDLARQGTAPPANATCVATEQAIISKLLMLGALADSLPAARKSSDWPAGINVRTNQMVIC